MDLQTILKALTKDGLTLEHQDATDEIPSDRLLMLVELEGRSEEEALVAEMMFIPGLEEELDDSDLLQFFAIVADELDETAQAAIRSALPQLNLNLPIGYFNLQEEDGFAYFRHVLPVPRGAGPKNATVLKVIAETAWLSAFVVNQGLPVLEKAVGKQFTG